MGWMMRQRILSAGLLITPKGEKWLIHQSHVTIHKNLDKLEKWVDGNPMKFDRQMCKVLYLERNNPMHQCILGAIQLGSSSAEKDLRS